MKKVFMIVTMVFALCVSAFADKSRFYENGKVIDTMYVGADSGLRVRAHSANRLLNGRSSTRAQNSIS